MQRPWEGRGSVWRGGALEGGGALGGAGQCVEGRGPGRSSRKSASSPELLGAATFLNELQGLLPLLQAKLIPLLSLVQVVHSDDGGRHADHVLFPAARGGHNEMLQALPIHSVLCNLGHRGPCSPVEKNLAKPVTLCSGRRLWAVHSGPRL
jgi:hypothetical protein